MPRKQSLIFEIPCWQPYLGGGHVSSLLFLHRGGWEAAAALSGSASVSPSDVVPGSTRVTPACAKEWSLSPPPAPANRWRPCSHLFSATPVGSVRGEEAKGLKASLV